MYTSYEKISNKPSESIGFCFGLPDEFSDVQRLVYYVVGTSGTIRVERSVLFV